MNNSKWIDITKEQPKEETTILAKLSYTTKIIKVTVTGNIWDYGIIKWKYYDDTK